MKFDWRSRLLYGAGGGVLGALGFISLGLWADQIDWTLTGLAAGGGFLLGLFAGRTALHWLWEILDWS